MANEVENMTSSKQNCNLLNTIIAVLYIGILVVSIFTGCVIFFHKAPWVDDSCGSACEKMKGSIDRWEEHGGCTEDPCDIQSLSAPLQARKQDGVVLHSEQRVTDSDHSAPVSLKDAAVGLHRPEGAGVTQDQKNVLDSLGGAKEPHLSPALETGNKLDNSKRIFTWNFVLSAETAKPLPQLFYETDMNRLPLISWNARLMYFPLQNVNTIKKGSKNGESFNNAPMGTVPLERISKIVQRLSNRERSGVAVDKKKIQVQSHVDHGDRKGDTRCSNPEFQDDTRSRSDPEPVLGGRDPYVTPSGDVRTPVRVVRKRMLVTNGREAHADPETGSIATRRRRSHNDADRELYEKIYSQRRFTTPRTLREKINRRAEQHNFFLTANDAFNFDLVSKQEERRRTKKKEEKKEKKKKNRSHYYYQN